jgi:hypothetical protein
MVRVTGALSNRQVAPRLEPAARAYARTTSAGIESAIPKRPVLRLPLGAIQDAVLAVLAEATEGLRPAAIVARVELRLGRWYRSRNAESRRSALTQSSRRCCDGKRQS